MGHMRRIWGQWRWVWGSAVIAAACCLATTVVFAPGYMSPDSFDQLRQATGKKPLTDWHPPVLSLVWRALIAVTGSPASMAVLQSVIFWAALWVTAWCVWESTGSRFGSLAVLGLGLTPQVLTFVGVVWKDVHMAVALLAATAVAFVGLSPRGGRARPALRWGLFGLGVLFLAYAMLVRKNAFFAAIPVFVMLVRAWWPRPGLRTWVIATVALVVGLAVPTAAISWIERPVRTKQVAQIMIDDLVHVLTVKELRAADVSPDLRDRLVAAAQKCDRIGSLSDAYWTCYDRPANGLIGDSGRLTSLWMREMSGHVPGYLQYRALLFTKLLFATGYPYHPGVSSNDLGLTVSHIRLEDLLDTYVNGAVSDLRPLFRGWFWLALALVLSVRPGRGAFSMPIRALGISSAAYILGYLPIMPATNYRYVYWPAIACTLGILLVWLNRGTAASAPTDADAEEAGSAGSGAPAGAGLGG
ncbi:hypothetical protein ACFYWX_09220 [Streptomyces sp. NPDC002888]|uniref:hypothetical protein n=1 Tax=Streptomyces sp. NPDC002888 TaxID=3364668 RepID=UPI003678B04F